MCNHWGKICSALPSASPLPGSRARKALLSSCAWLCSARTTAASIAGSQEEGEGGEEEEEELK